MAQTERQHKYLGLPGKFKTRVPQEIVFPNMDSARVDEFYLNDQDILINLEEETGMIREKTFSKFSKYLIFGSFMYYPYRVYLAVICHKNPKKKFECWQYSPSMYILVHYIYFSQGELWEKYENLIKFEQNKELTEMEALDIAFIAKFISKKHAPFIVESLAKNFKNAIITDKKLKIDVAVILSSMVIKHVTGEKQERLLEMIDLKYYETEMDRIIYEEYGDKLDKKDEEIKELNDVVRVQEDALKSKDDKIKSQSLEIEKLSKFCNTSKELCAKLLQLDVLNDVPEVKNIIQSLMLL